MHQVQPTYIASGSGGSGTLYYQGESLSIVRNGASWMAASRRNEPYRSGARSQIGSNRFLCMNEWLLFEIVVP
jgi:hypothetical protein